MRKVVIILTFEEGVRCIADSLRRVADAQPKKLLMWQFTHDPNDINDAIKFHDEDWEGLESAEQIVSITWNTSHMCYVVFWVVER